VSFTVFARHSRDAALPLFRRVSALRSCVQLYRPLGFNATLTFLHETAGPHDRDEHALLRALAMLEQSRTGWHAHLGRYAADRAVAKHHGHRSPRLDVPNPNGRPPIWYGAPGPAAVHALAHWRRQRLRIPRQHHRVVAEVEEFVEAWAGARWTLTPDDVMRLQAGIATLNRRPPDYDVRGLLIVARNVAATAEA
jgi:hypothetical protein